MKSSRRKILALVCGIGFAALVIAAGTVSFQRKVASFRPLSFTVSPEAAGWRVVDVEASGPDLVPGDLIQMVNGVEAGTVDDLYSFLAARAESELFVLRGDGSAVTVPVARPDLQIDFPYLILAAIGALYLLVGLYTLLRNRGPTGALFYAWCLLYALFFLVTTVGIFDGLDRVFYALDQIARLVLPPLTVHFFLVFPARRRKTRWLSRGAAFLYLPAAVLLTLQLDLILANGSRLLGSGVDLGAMIVRLERLDLYHLVLFTLFAAGVLAYRASTEQGWQEKRQTLWMAVGLGAGYLPFLGYLLLQRWAGPGIVRSATWIEILAVLPLALVPIAFAVSILRYKLWDLDVILRDSVSYTAAAIAAVFGFSLVNMAVSYGLPDQMGAARNLISFSAGLVFAAMVTPVKRQVSLALERIQYRNSYTQRRALTGLAQRLLQERDLQTLCHELLDRTQEALELERLNLYLAQGDDLLRVRPESDLPERVPMEAFGEESWEHSVGTLSSLELPLADATDSRRLFKAGYRYVFPVTVRDSRVGLAVASYKMGSQPLNSDDQDLMRAVLNQAALAIENAQLLEQVHSQLDEMSRLQQYSNGILESSPAGTAVLDGEDRVTSVNAAFCRVTDREEGEIIGRPLEESLPVRPLPEPADGLVEASYCNAAGDERHLQLRVAHFRPGGEGHPVDGRGGMKVLIVHDVTDKVALENAVKEQDRLASLGMLAAGVAHEVNTPLTGISSYAQMLLDDTPEEDPRRRLLKKVEAQTFRAARIVNNLLEFARNRNNEYRPVALDTLLDDTLDLLQERLSKKGIRLSWNRPEGGEPVVVEGNDGELQQVFTNLLLNAQDAMSETGGHLKVELRAEGDRALAIIEDDGPGIPRERLDKIFQPFYSTKLNRGGTGLGLSISYDIVRRHHGEMRVWSRLGEGTRFTVDLPLGRSES